MKDRKVGGYLVLLIGGALLLYTGYRSYDFVSMTFPDLQQKILAFAALLALDGGIIAWAIAFMMGCRGNGQRQLTMVMTVVDFIGAFLMFTIDTLYRAAESNMSVALSQDTVYISLIAMSIIIAMNVGATVMFHMIDPERRLKMAKQQTEDQIEEMSIELLAKNAPVIAAELAPLHAQQMIENMRRSHMALLGQTVDVSPHQVEEATKRKAAPSPSQSLKQRFSMNGNGNGKHAPAEEDSGRPF